MAVPAEAAAPLPAALPKLCFLATEDWYFWSDRLPSARALRDAGCRIAVAAREQRHAEQLRGEGFTFHALAWRRGGDGILGALRAVRGIVRVYRREQPTIVNHLALKAIFFGGLARRLAFGRKSGGVASIAWVMGLGSALSGDGLGARWRCRLLGWGLRLLTRDCGGRIVVQNPEDGAALVALGIDRQRVALIRGSGVDTGHFVPLPEPGGPIVTVALVARMLRSKGVAGAVAAVGRLRRQGVPIRLVLAGAPDPDSRDSLDERELAAFAGEPGVSWLGRVEDVRDIWRDAAIAVFPSIYGEGLPRALLEAAACARPIVATDMPGCREVVRDGETGLLVPPRDSEALAAALASLAADPQRRRAMGDAGRALVERELSEARIVRDTLQLYETVLREQEAAR